VGNSLAVHSRVAMKESEAGLSIMPQFVINFPSDMFDSRIDCSTHRFHLPRPLSAWIEFSFFFSASGFVLALYGVLQVFSRVLLHFLDTG
jgi:hypothetical protein